VSLRYLECTYVPLTTHANKTTAECKVSGIVEFIISLYNGTYLSWTSQNNCCMTRVVYAASLEIFTEE
jgi:hypothetical protein